MHYESTSRTETVVNSFVSTVYMWMTIGLLLTGAVSWYMESSGLIIKIVNNPLLFMGLLIGELGIVFYLSSRVSNLTSQTATILFLFYSVLNGVTLSVIFLAYTKSSIISTFFICSATFGICSLYGYFTKKDLTSVGGFMMMGLIGLLIAMVVNMFLRSSAMYYLIGCIGVIVFVGLTSYDAQKVKMMARSMPNDLDGSIQQKGAIMGALSLYLDFINLFLMLLRIFGGAKD